ncbi:hypothetical protein AC579_9181 [Pseudocercospora musae]|uniref:Uncharacterized protein n=1 Tax=Pseudocercospora musae TaxID=113226 RepID=A0A139I751_9PEZI|nr:hypothetical protein AC579_9181 [Pseudocercospora musae]
MHTTEDRRRDDASNKAGTGIANEGARGEGEETSSRSKENILEEVYHLARICPRTLAQTTRRAAASLSGQQTWDDMTMPIQPTNYNRSASTWDQNKLAVLVHARTMMARHSEQMAEGAEKGGPGVCRVCKGYARWQCHRARLSHAAKVSAHSACVRARIVRIRARAGDRHGVHGFRIPVMTK